MRVDPRTIDGRYRISKLASGDGQASRRLTLIEGHVFDETGDDSSGFRLSDIDRLNVERVGIRVKLDCFTGKNEISKLTRDG